MRSMIGELLSEVDGRVGHACLGPGLVRILCASPRQFFLQSPGQEKHLFIPLCDIVVEIQLSVQTWSKR